MARQSTTDSVKLPRNLAAGAKSRVRPSDSTSAGSTLRQTAIYDLINRSANAYRTSTNTTQLMRELARIEGPISSAVNSLVQIANSGFRIWVADAATNRFSYEGWLLSQSILAALDTTFDYTEGYAAKDSSETIKQVLLREAVITGGCSMELVLNKARLPDTFLVVGLETLEWVSDGKGGKYPTQRIAGQNQPQNLNIPTFFTAFAQPDPGLVQARSMMESCLKLLVFFEEFLDDIRRAIRQNGHTRTSISIDVEKILESAPKDVINDADKLREYLEGIRDQIVTNVQGLAPEDALVTFDTVKVENLQSGLGNKVDYNPMLTTLSGLYATAMKTPPSAIGLRLESGSQALGNVESLIFAKTAKAIQAPVEQVLSRAITLACRLFGLNVYCNFMFKKIDLRPESELEAFRVMEQDRILDLLSLGMISDEEAAWELDLGPLPEGYVPLSGTRFRDGTAKKEFDPNSADSAMGKVLQPGSDLPRKGGGRSQ
jgi:hypothetical protein